MTTDAATDADRILRRVRGLLDKAESTTNEHEREALVTKAQTLMVRHAIDQGMLAAAGKGQQAGASPEARSMIYTDGIGHIDAKRNLLGVVAKANRCRVVFFLNRGRRSQGGEQRAEIVGFPADLDWTDTLYTSLLLQLYATGRPARAAYTRDTKARGEKPVHGRQFFDSFARGFIASVRARLAEAEQAATTQADVDHGTPGSALVLADRQQVVVEFFVQRHPHLGRTSSSAGRSGAGYGAGRAAGDRADLTGSSRGLGAKGALPGKRS
jgi:hypothetical protein